MNREMPDARTTCQRGPGQDFRLLAERAAPSGKLLAFDQTRRARAQLRELEAGNPALGVMLAPIANTFGVERGALQRITLGLLEGLPLPHLSAEEATLLFIGFRTRGLLAGGPPPAAELVRRFRARPASSLGDEARDALSDTVERLGLAFRLEALPAALGPPAPPTGQLALFAAAGRPAPAGSRLPERTPLARLLERCPGLVRSIHSILARLSPAVRTGSEICVRVLLEEARPGLAPLAQLSEEDLAPRPRGEDVRLVLSNLVSCADGRRLARRWYAIWAPQPPGVQRAVRHVAALLVYGWTLLGERLGQHAMPPFVVPWDERVPRPAVDALRSQAPSGR